MLTMMLKKWHAVESMFVVFHLELSGGRDLIRAALYDSLMGPDSRIVPFLEGPERDHEGQCDQGHQKRSHRTESVTIPVTVKGLF